MGAGSIRAVLGGGVPRRSSRPDEPLPLERTDDHAPMRPSSEAGDRFALAHHVLALRDTSPHTRHHRPGGREALPRRWLDRPARLRVDHPHDVVAPMTPTETKAIDLLVELRNALRPNATR